VYPSSRKTSLASVVGGMLAVAIYLDVGWLP